MAPVVIVIVAAAVVVALGLWSLSRRNRHADGVDSFRRQIDALSPQARRSTVEQLNPEPPHKSASDKPAPDAPPEDPADG